MVIKIEEVYGTKKKNKEKEIPAWDLFVQKITALYDRNQPATKDPFLTNQLLAGTHSNANENDTPAEELPDTSYIN